MRSKIYQRVLSKYGVEHQLGMLQEEAAEVIQAVNKLRRDVNIKQLILLMNQEEIDPTLSSKEVLEKAEEKMSRILSEVADFIFVARQLFDESVLESEIKKKEAKMEILLDSQNGLTPGVHDCPECWASPLLYGASRFDPHEAVCTMCHTPADKLEKMFKAKNGN